MDFLVEAFLRNDRLTRAIYLGNKSKFSVNSMLYINSGYVFTKQQDKILLVSIYLHGSAQP